MAANALDYIAIKGFKSIVSIDKAALSAFQRLALPG
jgi:hypothetical protein